MTSAPWHSLHPQKLTTRLVSKSKNVLTPPRKLSPLSMMPLLLIMITTTTHANTHKHTPLPLPLHRRVATTTRTRITTKWSRRRRILLFTNLLSPFLFFTGVDRKSGQGECKIEPGSSIGPEQP